MLREKDLPGHLNNDTGETPQKAESETGNAHQEESFQQINSILDMAKRLEQDNQLRRALEALKKE